MTKQHEKFAYPQERPNRYSASFIEKAKRVLPDMPEIHKALETGQDSVGSILYEYRNFPMSPEEILKALNNDPKIIEDAAKKTQILIELYNEWVQEYKE